MTIDRLATQVGSSEFDLVAGIEARGFVFASALAYKLDASKNLWRIAA